MKAGAAVLALLLAAGCTSGDIEMLAERAVAAGRHEEARRYYHDLVARHPDNDDYLLWVARLSGWLQDYGRATKTYDQVLARTPHNTEALVGKAYVLAWQQRRRDAIRLLRAAKRVEPHNREIVLALARLYRDDHRPDLAGRLVDRLLATDPTDPEVRTLGAALGRNPPPIGVLARLRRTLCRLTGS